MVLMKESGEMESWGLVRGARLSCVLFGGGGDWGGGVAERSSGTINSIQVQSTERGLSE